MPTVDTLLDELRAAADIHTWAHERMAAIAALNGDAGMVWAELVRAGVDADAVVRWQAEAAKRARHAGATDAPDSAALDLSWMDGLDAAALEKAALERGPILARLDPFAVAMLCTELNARGVTKSFTDRVLRPALNKMRPAAQPMRATWRDYVDAAAEMGYSFRLNDLTEQLETRGAHMTDAIEAVLLTQLHERGLTNAELARRAFLAEGAAHRYHPVREYLNGLTWDGKDHIGHMALYIADEHDPIRYADGTARSVFHAVFRRWLIGAAAKVFDPDAAQNFVPALDGGQGLGKSTWVRWLCPLPGLHTEKSLDPDNKDDAILSTQTFVWELPELGALLRKADRESMKAFLTTQHVSYRPPYGRHAVRKPSLASYIATVNFEGALLDDPTGNRRFFPVTLTGIDHAYANEVDLHQLWAQAVALYRAGEPWRLCPEERTRQAEITQAYEVEDVLAGYILQWFDVDPTTDTFTHTTTIIDRLRTYAGIRDSGRGFEMRLAQSLKRLGLGRDRRQVQGRQGSGWVGITPNDRELVDPSGSIGGR